jgi:hypothetical protein
MAKPISDLNNPKAVAKWAKALADDIMRESLFVQKFPPKPLTRKEKMALRLRNYIDRLRRAWLVLRHDYELEEE